MHICIIDDELKSAEVLQALIEVVEGQEHEITLFTDPEKAVAELVGLSPELVFLDIKMPGLDGFEFLNALPDRLFTVIFTTAYEQYAIKAIKSSAFDYLLKPVDETDLRSTFERFRNRSAGDMSTRLSTLNANLNISEPELFKICLSTADRKYFIEVNRIVRCEADGNYTSFHLSDNSRLLSSRTLKDYEELLLTQGFLRVHKSHLVNPRHIESMLSSRALKMSDGATIPLARRRRKDIRHLLHIASE